ncbi:MAG: hypothetical protein WKG52_16105 [Variovorax sp.]
MPLFTTVYGFRRPTGEVGPHKISMACRDSDYPDCFLLLDDAQLRIALTASDIESLLGRKMKAEDTGAKVVSEVGARIRNGERLFEAFKALGLPGRVPAEDLDPDINLLAAQRLAARTIAQAHAAEACRCLRAFMKGAA